MFLRPVLFAVLLIVAGCSPGLDWRQFQPDGAGVAVTFPCRPDRNARDVMVAGVPARVEMLACTASGSTFALTFFDVSDPAAVSPTLRALRAAAQANIVGDLVSTTAADVPGMTPNPQSARLSLAGRLPDGTAVREHAVFVVKGLRIYQASVIGARAAPDVADTFFAGMKFAS
jgi:hypothetical protein